MYLVDFLAGLLFIMLLKNACEYFLSLILPKLCCSWNSEDMTPIFPPYLKLLPWANNNGPLCSFQLCISLRSPGYPKRFGPPSNEVSYFFYIIRQSVLPVPTTGTSCRTNQGVGIVTTACFRFPQYPSPPCLDFSNFYTHSALKV